MNKRRNKSVTKTKTKHRVQKTKRTRRLDKNRSVKGIRGKNKTKVVGKRRNIVQRGGGEINNLVSRIFHLVQIQNVDERTNLIQAILKDINPSNLIELARGHKQSVREYYPDGPSLLYAACRLKNPSVELVEGILEKMKVNDSENSVIMYSIISNGVSNGSYPQHAAVQAAKEILQDNPDDVLHRIQKILTILSSLKRYDDNLAQHINDRKKVMSPSGLLPVGTTHIPLMNKKNKLSDGREYTAYEEYIFEFDRAPSIRSTLESTLQGRAVNINDFDNVLNPTGAVSVAAPSTGAVPYTGVDVSNWEERIDRENGRTFWYNKITKQISWNKPVSHTHSVPVTNYQSPSALPPGWQEMSDPTSGRVYYGNPATGTTQWERPTTGSVSVAAPSALPPGWHAMSDPASGRVYYGNPATGTTQWERPTTGPGFVAAASALPQQGQEIWNEQNIKGNIFYENAVTHESTRFKPDPLPPGWRYEVVNTSGVLKTKYFNPQGIEQSRPTSTSSSAAPGTVSVAAASAGTVSHPAAVGNVSSTLEPGGRNNMGMQPPGTPPFLPGGFFLSDFKGYEVHNPPYPWTLQRDKDNKQRVYYYNINTKETRELKDPPTNWP
jgi:hypothetical protein